jgi:hypothetical protein
MKNAKEMQRSECEHCKKEEYINTIIINACTYCMILDKVLRYEYKKVKKMYKNISWWTNILQLLQHIN